MFQSQIAHILLNRQDEAKQRLRIHRYYIAAGSSLLVISLMFACALQGFLSLSDFYQSAALVLFFCLLFFILFRFGLNQRFGDPSLTRLQMWSSTVVIVYTMYLADKGRAVFLVILLMIFLFGVLRLTRQALLWHAAGILLAYGMLIGLLWHFKRHTLDLQLELLQWIALAATMPWFAMMGGYISGLRKKQTRLNRTLRLLSDCNIAMVHATSERELFNNLCRILSESGGYPVARADLVDHDAARTVRQIAQYRCNETCTRGNLIDWEATQDVVRTLADTAIRSGTTQVSRSFPGEPGMARRSDVTPGENDCTWAVLPLIADGQTVGAISLCSENAAAFHREELCLLEELAANLVYGMQSLRAREELVTQRQLLEQRVEQRTQEIAKLNAALETKAEDAQIANRAKSAFVATFSHEIRNPLNAVVGLTRLLADSELNSIHRQYVDNLQLSTQTLSMLIGDILDLSRIEAGALYLEQAPFSLDALLHRVAAVVSSSLRAKRVEMVFDVAPDMPVTMIGDMLRLQQILLNLAGNAAKFTEKGDLIISVQPIAQHDGQITVQFSVRDTGIGIPGEYLGQIFDVFSQGDASRAREYGGAGLGLAISARLAELMGTRIAVESAVGKGTTFSFSVTLAVPEGTPATQAMPEPIGLRLLIIDAHPLVGDILQRLCSASGWHATVARSAAVGLEKLRLSATQGQGYDLMLLDWRTHTRIGVKMLRQAFDGPENRMPPVLLTAACHEAALAADACDGLYVRQVLSKPVTMASFVEAVRCACGINVATELHEDRKTDLRLAAMRLLVAEDNTINQQVIEQLLRQAGADVIVVANGLEAINELRNPGVRFDAVLMDIHMPIMDGYTATQIIREKLGRPDLPIIALTANALSDDIEKSRRVGMIAHLTKPIDIADLLAVLANERQCPQQLGADHGQASKEPTQLVPLPVVDVSAGLASFNGNWNNFTELLQQFVITYRNLAAEVRHHLDAAETAFAMEVLHGMHGAARFLQIRHLASVIAALCTALRQNHGGAAMQSLDELQYAMQTLENFVEQLDERQEVSWGS